MEERISKNTPSKYVTVIVFAIFAIAALLAFGYAAIDVTVSLISRKEIIEFNKGAMYMLGVGLGAGLLVIFMIHELSGKVISSSYNKKATKLALLSVGMIVVIPQLADYAVSLKVKGMNYVSCGNLSYRWLHVQTKVYGISIDTCKEVEIAEKE